MNRARIAELLQPFLHGANDQRPAANDALIQSISTYIDLLERWNARINLTAIRDSEEIVTRHFGESLFAARHLFPTRAADFSTTTHVGTAALGCPAEQSSAVAAAEGRQTSSANINDPESIANDQPTTTNHPITLADLGSGAGFPGIPIKLWAPEISLTLIESNHKKATFLREVTRALTLTNVDIKITRAETLAGREFDIVTLRAVERFETVLPIAASLVAPGGRLALLIGSGQLAQAQTMSPSDFKWFKQQPVPQSKSRVLALAQAPG